MPEPPRDQAVMFAECVRTGPQPNALFINHTVPPGCRTCPCGKVKAEPGAATLLPHDP